jgi:hypothetical protein
MLGLSILAGLSVPPQDLALQLPVANWRFSCRGSWVALWRDWLPVDQAFPEDLRQLLSSLEEDGFHVVVAWKAGGFSAELEFGMAVQDKGLNQCSWRRGCRMTAILPQSSNGLGCYHNLAIM